MVPEIMQKPIRRTKIIATIGPSTEEPDILRGIIGAGVDIIRLNLSHGSQEEHARHIGDIREACRITGRCVAVMMDIPGPKLRIHRLPREELVLTAGETILLSSEENQVRSNEIIVGPAGYIPTVIPGDEILLADGAASLCITGINENIEAVVQSGGRIRNGAGVVIPGRRPDIPYINETFTGYLRFAADMQPDFIALSFVSSGQDVENTRLLLANEGITIPIIAKIETKLAVEHFDEILLAADGIMVARGDLGVELPIQQVPHLQNEIIRKTNRAGKPVITATEMLESMIHQGRPTRAEVNDVANAIIEGTDATMLSGETSIGEYPVQAVSMMAKIAEATEKHLPYRKTLEERGSWREKVSIGRVVSYNACFIADELSSRALVAYTRSGLTAERVSACRPCTPILAITPDEKVFRRLLLWWGVIPYLHSPIMSADELFAAAVMIAKKTGIGIPGEELVIIAGNFSGQQGTTSMINVQEIT